MASTARDVFFLAIAAVAFRLLFIQAYRSTDFEVHRNWLAITHSLPLSKWYYEDTSQWTLDYPPLFAYFEWFLSHFAVLFDPQMLVVANLEYASFKTIVFQRLSVIAGDIVLLCGAWRAGSICAPKSSPGSAAVSVLLPMAIVLFNPALLIVDHIHFQYNGMLLGLLLLSAADLEDGKIYRGAILFSALLNMKQIFLYVSPVFFVYLLRRHCGCAFESKGFAFRFPEFVRLGCVVIATFAIAWAPIVFTGQVAQAASRLFPFGRGLTHAYWAPNLWAFYNTADRVLAKLGLGAQQGHSSTSGMAEVYESSVLWTVPPKATFVLTAIAYIPLLAIIWKQTPLPPRSVIGSGEFLPATNPCRRPGAFVLYVALGCAVSFSLGWHVHEKAILMVTIPLLVAAAASRSRDLIEATALLSIIATFSVLPLLPHRRFEAMLKWVLLAVCHKMELGLMRRCCGGDKVDASLDMLRVGPLPGYILASCLLVFAVYCDFGGHERIFGPRRMEFLPLMLISDFSTVFVLGSFLRIYRLVARPKDGRDATPDNSVTK